MSAVEIRCAMPNSGYARRPSSITRSMSSGWSASRCWLPSSCAMIISRCAIASDICTTAVVKKVPWR
ncbi:hypothetical protein [Amycolatopsis sp. Hca4]|uniref:hypothetical protein n=1 Tax=Amycolatopsis sp. Hca4 TaxID=2742131 RepID=UPI0020CB1377|nr:hypothetical protein [Amycolatopsis sp. Hca4]